MPMDIEWAKDGEDGQLYIVQARPETVASQRRRRLRDICAQGHRARARHRPGRRREDRRRANVRVIADARELADLPPRRGAGRGGDEPGLGAGDEDRRRDRHRPRRAHLPCGDRRARTWRSRRGRRRRRDARSSDRDSSHGLLRRRRDRPRL